MALAAVLLLALGFGTTTLIQDWLAGGVQMARVESVEGSLYRVAGDSSKPIAAGAAIAEGEEIRTAKGSTAMVRMTDGSRIEMGERAGLSLDAARKGNTIQLERGRIIVQAAKQRPRHLYVATRDALVSVTGTIFSVNSGTKGSRVSVVEGEVHVGQGPKDTVLHPGGQVATSASVEAIPVKDEVAWSRNAKQYQDLLAELTAAGKDIDARVERPGLRYSTRLLDLAPEGTTIFVALPNLSHSLTQTQQILDQKIAESPSLAQWWGETLGSTQNETKFHDMIQRLGDLGQNLGDEVAIAMNCSDGSKGQAVLMAEVTNEASFRASLEAEVARLNGSEGKTGLKLRRPATRCCSTSTTACSWPRRAAPRSRRSRRLPVAAPTRSQLRASTSASPRTTTTAPAGCSRPTSAPWWRRGRPRSPRRRTRRPSSSASWTSTTSSSTAGRSTAGPRPAPP
jgi:hypothetical protein